MWLELPKEADLALDVTVPMSREVSEANPDCQIRGAYEKGVLMSTLDTRHQTHQQRLGVGSKTDLHWGPEQCLEAPEVSGVAGPLRSRVLRRAG